MKPMTKVPDLRYEPDWRRLKFVIDQSGMSEQEFARFADLFDPDIITRIRYAQCGIDRELAEQINAKFPQYSVGWLLGESDAENPLITEMFPDMKTMEYVTLRLFDQAKQEFDSLSDDITKMLLQLIPLDERSRVMQSEDLTENLRQMTNLLELMRQCVQPATQESFSEAVGIAEEFCAAARKLLE